MYLDLAPMEGITGAIFRQLHHEYFPGVDRYYTPFLSPSKEHQFGTRELREILPENNRDVMVVPQLMTKVAEDFLWAAAELAAMGYIEVNLNLGCPSGTVTAKGKGSGMLSDPDGLNRFLDGIFANPPCKISIKTRLGMNAPEEFDAILAIYNQYPIAELIIHPRVRNDFYRHPVRSEAFDKAYLESKNPVSYNGGIVTAADHASLVSCYPLLSAVMIGQGLIADPFLAGKIKSGVRGDKQLLKEFHDRLFETYAVQFNSRPNAMKRMKEMWVYLICSFAEHDQHRKKLLKSKTPEEYLSVTSSVFRDLPLLQDTICEW